MHSIDADPLAPGTRVRLRGDVWTIVARAEHRDCTSLRLTGCGALNRAAARTFLLPFDRAAVVDAPRRIRVVRRRRWLHEVRRLCAATHPFGGLRTAASARIVLLPFQLEPALAVLRHGRPRVLIADEVGLGKTVQAGLVLSELAADRDEFRALVLTPAGVREQWRTELLERFTLSTTLADTAWLRTVSNDLPPSVNPWTLPGIYVASLDLVKRPEVLRSLEDTTWDVLVVDEVHGAGMGTARLAAAHALGMRSRRVLLLTATPPDDEPAHFDALTSIGRLHAEERMTVFRRTRADAGIIARRKTVLLPVRLSRAEHRMHALLDEYTSLVWHEADARGDGRGKLAAILLRKRALSGARSLSLSVRRRLALLAGQKPVSSEPLQLPLFDEDPLPDVTPDHVLGAAGLTNLERERDLLERLASAAEKAAGRESKLAFLRRLLARIREPVIVFTEYRDTLAHLTRALRAHQPLLLHGEVTAAERAAVQREFNESGRLLLATDAASEGLNLHHRCRAVVHFELPWTPMRLEQRTGRVDRLGQLRPVHEILLVAQHTCERLVLAPLITRVRTAAAAGRPSALASLPESRVASAVLGGERLPDVAAPRPDGVDEVDFGEEAHDECERIRCLRKLSRDRDACVPRPPGLFVSTGRGDGATLTVVVRIRIETADGAVVHEELLPLVAPAPVRDRPRSCAAAAQIAAAVIDGRSPAFLAAVRADVRTQSALAEARASLSALARRERWMAERLPAAQRQLVQVGLFDRRAVVDAAARHHVGVTLLEDAQSRLTGLNTAELQTSTAVVAIHFGRLLEP